MSNTAVVITGTVPPTPLGGDVASTWDGLLAGRSGIRTIEADWVDKYDLPVKIGAQLAADPLERLPRVQSRRLDRCEQVAVIAARQAWADAGFTEPTDDHQDVEPERLGVTIGTGVGGAVTLTSQKAFFRGEGST